MELAEPLVTINEETVIFTLNNKFDNNKYDEKLIKKLSILYKFSKIYIKPDNILLGKDDKLKLSDFFISLIMNE